MDKEVEDEVDEGVENGDEDADDERVDAEFAEGVDETLEGVDGKRWEDALGDALREEFGSWDAGEQFAEVTFALDLRRVKSRIDLWRDPWLRRAERISDLVATPLELPVLDKFTRQSFAWERKERVKGKKSVEWTLNRMSGEMNKNKKSRQYTEVWRLKSF